MVPRGLYRGVWQIGASKVSGMVLDKSRSVCKDPPVLAQIVEDPKGAAPSAQNPSPFMTSHHPRAIVLDPKAA